MKCSVFLDFFFKFFCYWWRDFFFLPVKDVLQPSAAASTSSRASPGVRSPLGLLPSKTGGRRWWKGSRTKRWEQEHVVSLENRWYEQGCVGAVTLFSYFSEPRATLSFGKSRHLITGQACFSPHLLSPPRSTEFFFLFKSDNLALRQTVQSTLCILRATLNSHLSTTCLFRAVFCYISQISTSFLPTVERRSRCCAWDSSTKQRNIHHRRRSSHLSLDCNWCGGKKRRRHCQKFYSLNYICFFVCGAGDLQSETWNVPRDSLLK